MISYTVLLDHVSVKQIKGYYKFDSYGPGPIKVCLMNALILVTSLDSLAFDLSLKCQQTLLSNKADIQTYRYLTSESCTDNKHNSCNPLSSHFVS